jgi:flagellar assembly factor FliW
MEMEIQGTRFGTLTFEREDVITIEEGLLGFPLSRRFLLFPYGEGSAFFWLQSVDEPDIAFIVINPFDFFTDLEFVIQDEDSASLGLERDEDVEVFTLVTIPEGRPEEMRTNLAGPVVVNVRNRLGKQVLMRKFSPRQPLIPEDLKHRFHKGTPFKGRRSRSRAGAMKSAVAG